MSMRIGLLGLFGKQPSIKGLFIQSFQDVLVAITRACGCTVSGTVHVLRDPLGSAFAFNGERAVHFLSSFNANSIHTAVKMSHSFNNVTTNYVTTTTTR